MNTHKQATSGTCIAGACSAMSRADIDGFDRCAVPASGPDSCSCEAASCGCDAGTAAVSAAGAVSATAISAAPPLARCMPASDCSRAPECAGSAAAVATPRPAATPAAGPEAQASAATLPAAACVLPAAAFPPEQALPLRWSPPRVSFHASRRCSAVRRKPPNLTTALTRSRRPATQHAAHLLLSLHLGACVSHVASTQPNATAAVNDRQHCTVQSMDFDVSHHL